MNLQRLPEDIKKAIKDLTNDGKFQKEFGSDVCLDKIDEEQKRCKDERKQEALKVMTFHRISELVADALIERGKLDSSKRQWFIDETAVHSYKEQKEKKLCDECKHKNDLVKDDGQSSAIVVEKRDSAGRLTDLYAVRSPACKCCTYFLDYFNGVSKENQEQEK